MKMCITDQEFDETYDEILRILLDDLEYSKKWYNTCKDMVSVFTDSTESYYSNCRDYWLKHSICAKNKVYQHKERIKLLRHFYQSG